MNTNYKAAIILVMLTAVAIGQSCAPAFAQYAPKARNGWFTAPIESPRIPVTSADPIVRAAVTMDPPEYRCSEVFGFASEFSSPAATTILIDKLYANNFNVVMPEIRTRGDAYYNSSYEPWSTDVVGGYDPLTDMLEQAHDKNMQVFGWIVTYRIWQRYPYKAVPSTHIWSKHPDWALMDRYGRNYIGNYYNLDPGIPGVEDYIVGVVKDIVTKYPTLDGINFDYIRYDGTAYGYNPISKARFKSEYGSDPPTSTYSSLWPSWSEWKRRQITDLVKRCYVEAIAINPKIKMTADTIGWSGVNPVTDFEHTRAYAEVCQDSKGWMEKHFLDINMLMNYKRDWNTAQSADYYLWSDYLAELETSSGRHCMDTNAGYLNLIDASMRQWQHDRDNGLTGLSLYRYGYACIKEDPNHLGYPLGYPSTVTQGDDTLYYAAIKSNMFQNPAPVPAMPWKDTPTRGYLFGQVTDALLPPDDLTTYRNWIYKAIVTAVGPSPSTDTYTAETDATGAYVIADANGVIDVPPGDYTITAAMNGFATSDPVVKTVTVGLATRANINLGPYIPPENFKGIAAALDSTATPDGTVIGINGKIVTAFLSDCVYIEELDRSKGIQVRFLVAAPAIAEGDRLNVIGKLATIGGERVLDHAAIMVQTPGVALNPLGSNVRDLSRMPTATALLVKCAGNVSDSGIGWFNLYDGSGTIKVKCAGLISPARGTFATVTGINAVDTVERSIRVRKQSDITPTSKTVITAPAGLIGPGLNLISLPYIPADQAPSVAFAGKTIDGRLFRWDNLTQQFIGYSSTTPVVFGDISPGDGFALLSTAIGSLSFEGIPIPTVDARIALPKMGWSLISDPMNIPVLWLNLSITDGIQTKSLNDAVTAGWIGRIAFTWDNTSGNYGYLGTGARGSRFDDSLRPWKAYWINTYQDNLAVIIPSGG